MNNKWNKTSDIKPAQNQLILGIDSGGAEHRLVFYKNLFWTEDMKIYVYFTPIYWKTID